jgi:hypothetical protein
VVGARSRYRKFRYESLLFDGQASGFLCVDFCFTPGRFFA